MGRADWRRVVTWRPSGAAIGGRATETKHVNAFGTWQRKPIGFNIPVPPNERGTAPKTRLKPPLGPAASFSSGRFGLISRTLAPRALQTCGLLWRTPWSEDCCNATENGLGVGLLPVGAARPPSAPRGPLDASISRKRAGICRFNAALRDIAKKITSPRPLARKKETDKLECTKVPSGDTK
ncbi:hypothetical protein HUJ05_011235 [Dendroctonus ponderosae]|nr:hypothetical protein HUJ05_011235 [Dendroctonus ponderosae]